LRTSAGIFDFEILMFLFSAGGRATLFEIASSIFSDRYAYAAGDGYLTWNAVGQEAIDAALPGILDGARAMALLNVAFRSPRPSRSAQLCATIASDHLCRATALADMRLASARVIR
jgi:hypothetical protein